MKLLKLSTTDESVLLDDADYDRVSQYKWRRFKGPKSTIARNYRVSGVTKRMKLSRFVYGPVPSGVWLVHVNGNNLDFRRSNLQEFTPCSGSSPRKVYKHPSRINAELSLSAHARSIKFIESQIEKLFAELSDLQTSRRNILSKINSMDRSILKSHRRRLATSLGYTQQDIKAMRVKQKGLCRICKADLDTHGYHIDHIIPIARGGKGDLSNIQLLCPSCNIAKSDHDPYEFAVSRGVLLF
jgi:5-methylcytosine-specific restriction endonuclease McrA